jgi:hypothetical protein
MSSVPELVFVNCCYLGKTDGAAEALYRNRFKLAANIGTQLIENGVKAVIAAGWAVDDAAAMEFTKVFMNTCLQGTNSQKRYRKQDKLFMRNTSTLTHGGLTSATATSFIPFEACLKKQRQENM